MLEIHVVVAPTFNGSAIPAVVFSAGD